jgi:hypothetical protein
MKMKTQLKFILSLGVVCASFAFHGCGGGGSAAFESKSAGIPIVACNSASPVYTVLQSGDTIVEQTSNTKVELVHDQNGNKQVCVLQGAAVINR